MTVEELDRLAYKDEEIPAGLRLPEIQYFKSMRILYREYRRKEVSKEQSAREKTTILRELEKGMAHEEYCIKTEQLWGRISTAVDDYVKNPCLITADNLVRTIFGLPENFRKKPIQPLPDEGEWEYVLPD